MILFFTAPLLIKLEAWKGGKDDDDNEAGGRKSNNSSQQLPGTGGDSSKNPSYYDYHSDRILSLAARSATFRPGDWTSRAFCFCFNFQFGVRLLGPVGVCERVFYDQTATGNFCFM